MKVSVPAARDWPCDYRGMSVDGDLVEAAVARAARRWPDGDAVAAAVRLAEGSVITGVSLPNFNAAITLCAETGPICRPTRQAERSLHLSA